MKRFLLFLFGATFMGLPVLGTLFAKLPRNIGSGGLFIAEASVAGPASYSAGGFTIDLGMATVTRFTVKVRDTRIAAPDDFVRSYVVSEVAGVITIVVSVIQLSATNTWAEIANAVDLSTMTWDVIALGEP